MEFLDAAEKIRNEYRSHGRDDIVVKIDECFMQGGTYGERFLILADMLRKLKREDDKTYQIADNLSELILAGADEFFKKD
jgi:hypothetical protein